MFQVKNPDELIGNKKIGELTKFILIAGIIIGICTHLYMFVGQSANEDALITYNTLESSYTSGRWLLPYVTAYRLHYTLPIVIATVSILCLTLTSIFTIKVLEVKSKFIGLLITMLIITFPSTAYLLGYMFLVDAYMIALLCATVAVYLAKQFKFGFIIGGLCLAISMSIYQAYIGYAIVLSMIFIILKALENISFKKMARYVGCFLSMGVIGVVSYLGSLKIFLMINKVELGSYKGINEIGKISFAIIPDLIEKAYTRFFGFFKSSYFYVTDSMKYLYIILLILAIVVLVYLIIRDNIYKKIYNVVIIIILILLLPIGVNIIDIIAPQTKSGNLTIHQFILLPILVLILVKQIMIKNIRFKNEIYWGTLISISILILNYFIISNIYYLKIDTFYNRTIALNNRIVARIEQLPEYKSGIPVAIIGNLPSDVYSNSSYMFPEIINDQGLWGQYIGLTSNSDVSNTLKFVRFVDMHLGMKMTGATQQQIEDIKSTNKFKNMSAWPYETSVDIINGFVVVNLDYNFYVETTYVEDSIYKFEVQNAEEYLEDYEYAWYLYKDEERIRTDWYAANKEIEYILTEPGEYKVAAFIRKIGTEHVEQKNSEKILVD